MLWINRISAHLTQKVDLGVEYRILRLWLPGDVNQIRHGMLVDDQLFRAKKSPPRGRLQLQPVR